MSFILLGILNSQAAGAGNFPLPEVEPDLWLDAADTATITESSGSVSQWNNKGRLGNFTQATSADQPTTGVSTLNGLNVLDFNDDFLVISGVPSDFTFLHDGSEYFICGVFQSDNVSRQNFILSTGTASAAGIGINWRVDDNNVNLDFFVSGGTLVVFVDHTLGATHNVWSVIADPDNATLADRASIFRNETLGDPNLASGTVSSSDSDSVMRVGATSAETLSFAGQIAELVIYSGADATETNRQAVVDYLNAKWSVF